MGRNPSPSMAMFKISKASESLAAGRFTVYVGMAANDPHAYHQLSPTEILTVSVVGLLVVVVGWMLRKA